MVIPAAAMLAIVVRLVAAGQTALDLPEVRERHILKTIDAQAVGIAALAQRA